MSWTDERIEKLTKMWESGATASQIAEDLGGVSRNAVIGKAHRLGLKARPSPVKANERPDAVVAAGVPASVPTGVPGEAASEPVAAAPSVVPEKPQARVVAADKPNAKQPSLEQPLPARELPPVARPVVAAPAAPAAAVTSSASEPIAPPPPRIVSVGPGGFLRQGPGDQQAPIPPAPPRRLVPAKPSPEILAKTSLLDLNDRICRWPMGHPGEPDFHFCGVKVNPGFPYCVEHCGRAYQAQLPRGHRRPPPPLPFGGPRVR
ncbi:MAG: GcrA cell cycle regulator [Pseudomonadota bacterium]|nr:GcrA cell cycle regulator [Pseudomonadota bacterium]